MAPKIGASYVGVLPNSSRPVHPIPQSGCSSIVHYAGGHTLVHRDDLQRV